MNSGLRNARGGASGPADAVSEYATFDPTAVAVPRKSSAVAPTRAIRRRVARSSRERRCSIAVGRDAIARERTRRRVASRRADGFEQGWGGRRSSLVVSETKAS